MKQIKYILLGFIFLLGAATQAHTLMPYPLDTINGQIYYRYTTPRSIGIYRISVNFGVSQEEILKANPHLMTRGLRVDEALELIHPSHNTTSFHISPFLFIF